MATPLADLLTQVVALRASTDTLADMLAEKTALQDRLAQLQIDIPNQRNVVSTAKQTLKTMLNDLESL